VSGQPPLGYRENIPAGPPPGWYPDPIERQALRWWDGAQWSQETRPRPGNVQEAQPLYPSQREQPPQPSFTPSPQDSQDGTTYQGQPQYSPSYGEDPYPQGDPPAGQQYPGPQHGAPPRGRRPRRSWFARHKVLTGLLSVVALFTIGIVGAAANSPRITPKAASSTASTPPAAQDTQSTASPTSSSPPTGSIGTTFTVTSSDGSSYDVTLDQVNQHATLAPYETLNNQADHAAAAEFTITGESGQSSDDANSDANAIGSDQTEYQFAALSLTVPNFNGGDFTIAPGQTEKGWVAFELPPGVTIAQVQWAPGIGGQAATWQLSS
jgi:Protein of unknown function (DUF2510)